MTHKILFKMVQNVAKNIAYKFVFVPFIANANEKTSAKILLILSFEMPSVSINSLSLFGCPSHGSFLGLVWPHLNSEIHLPSALIEDEESLYSSNSRSWISFGVFCLRNYCNTSALDRCKYTNKLIYLNETSSKWRPTTCRADILTG